MSNSDEFKTNNSLQEVSRNKIRANIAARFGWYIVLLLTALVSIIPRLSWPYYNGQYLWAEDGPIYLNQAAQLSIHSLWTPYAGYLQIYPRLIALIGSLFPLSVIPIIYLAGWFFALAVTVIVITSRLKTFGVGTIGIALGVTSILLQPNSGEVFFNIVNSQWLIGLALAIYLMVPTQNPPKLAGIFGVVIAGLSGPFSLIYAFVLGIKTAIKSELKTRWRIYLFILVTAAIQLYYIMLSQRLSPPVNIHAYDFIKAITGIMLFSVHGLWRFPITIFWISMSFFIRKDYQSNRLRLSGIIVIISLIITGFAIWVAAVYSLKGNPGAAVGVVFGSGDRYTFIPYACFLIAYIMVCANRPKRYLLFALCVYPSFLSVLTPISVSLNTKNTEFASFAKFSHYANNVVIPINPMWPAFPGWSISGGVWFQRNRHGHSLAGMDFKSAEFRNIVRVAHSLIIHNIGEYLGRSSYIGLEVDMFHEQPGWIQVFWKKNGRFTMNNSLERYYPSGNINAQYAFPNKGPISILISRSGFNNINNVRLVKVYCPTLDVLIKNDAYNPEREIVTPSGFAGMVALPLFEGQSSVARFVLSASQLNGAGEVSSVGLYQGNYGNTANGQMQVKICSGKACAVGSRPLSQSHDNTFFTVPLKTPLVVRPGQVVMLTITHQGGNKPEALWVWPTMTGYPQNLVGPHGPLPGKGLRIALKYHLQDTQ